MRPDSMVRGDSLARGNSMLRRGLALMLFAACGSEPAPAVVAPPTSPAPRVPADAAASTSASASASATWAIPDLASLAFCGPDELVTAEVNGALHRWRIADGRATAKQLLADRALASAIAGEVDKVGEWGVVGVRGLECSADGTVLAVIELGNTAQGTITAVATVDRAGVHQHYVDATSIGSARFANDGTIHLATPDVAYAWRPGTPPVKLREANERALFFAVADGGAIVERIYHDPPRADDGLDVYRGKVRTHYVGHADVSLSDAQLSIAPDGALAVMGDGAMTAYGWSTSRGRPGRMQKLMSNPGYAARGVLVTAGHWFTADPESMIWMSARAALDWERFAKPCRYGDDEESDSLVSGAWAISPDERYLAVACARTGVRLVSFESGAVSRPGERPTN